MKLKDKIKILRKVRGLSQQDLGDRLSKETYGLSRQAISDWENGNSEPKLDNIRDLAKVFNVSFDALLDESIDLNDNETLMAVLNQNKGDSIKNRVFISETLYRSHILPILLMIGLIMYSLFVIANRGYAIEFVSKLINGEETIMGQIKDTKEMVSLTQEDLKTMYSYVLYVVTWMPIVIFLVIIVSKTKSRYKVATITQDGVYLTKRNMFIPSKMIKEVRKSKLSFKGYGILTIETKENKTYRIPFVFSPYRMAKFYEKITKEN